MSYGVKPIKRIPKEFSRFFSWNYMGVLSNIHQCGGTGKIHKKEKLNKIIPLSWHYYGVMDGKNVLKIH